MPNINSQVESSFNPNSIGSILQNTNNVFNQALTQLPSQPTDTNFVEEVTTDTSTTNSTDFLDLGTEANALDYQVWATSWTAPSSEAISVVPLVFVDGFFGGTGTTNSTDDLVSDQNYDIFKQNLLSVPEGRRVIQPRFWSNVPWNYTWDNIEKLNWTIENDGVELGGEKYLFTPWYDNTITDAKTSVSNFFGRCQTDNLTFNYVADNSSYGDGQAPLIWTIGKNARIGDCPNTTADSQQWEKCVCGLRHYTCTDWASPDILEAIVTDSRFNTQTNPLNGKTLQTDFFDRYELIMNDTLSFNENSLYYSAFGNSSWYNQSAVSALDALTPLFGFSSDTLPWTNASKNAATRAWNATILDWGNLHYRLELFEDGLNNNGYSDIKISEYNQYPMSSDEMLFTEDLNSWQDGPRDDHQRFYSSPSLYGEVEKPDLFAYKLNAATDIERYSFFKINPESPTPSGYERISQPSWLAFLLDLRKTRAILRSTENGWEKFKPWIISPTFDISSRFRYNSDDQYGRKYWKELVFHLCLHGATTFHYFNENEESTEILHEVLNEWRNISLNSYSQPTNLVKIAVGGNTIISGGKLSNTGKYLWRITAKPSSSNKLKIFGSSVNRTDIPQEITLDSDSRGVWLETNSNIVPLYVLDDISQTQTNDVLYLTEIEPLKSSRADYMKGLYGGHHHDYGSGTGLQNGKSLGGVQYLKNENVVPEERWYESTDSYAYQFLHDLNDDGTAKQHSVRIDKNADGTDEIFDLSGCSSACYVGEPCYNSVNRSIIWFAEEMAKSGEWGEPMRPDRPWPNKTYYGTLFTDYITSTIGGKELVHRGELSYNDSLPTDLVYTYETGTNSFWNRDIVDGGRNDLKYNYDGQGTITFVEGHKNPILLSDISREVDGSLGENHVKMEPGSSWKYIGNCYAPIRLDDGCADSIYIDHAIEGMQFTKQYAELTYRTNNITNAPECSFRSSNFRNFVDDYFENGVYKPKILHIDIEDRLTNMITAVNPTYRAAKGQYVGVSGQLITDTIWQRIVSQIKLMRKLTHYAKQVYGNQVKVHFYSPLPFSWWPDWAPNWYPTNGAPSLWGDVTDLPTLCPFCEELDIGYEGDEWYDSLNSAQKIEVLNRAVNALRNKVFAFQNALTKMLMFETDGSTPDILDLTSELKELMPHLDESNFVITGLNHYSNSALDFLSQSTYVAYAFTGGIFKPNKQPYPHPIQTEWNNKAHANFVRAVVKNGKDMVRTGLYKNQIFAQMFTHTIQGNCGSDVAPHTYEYWNCDLKNESGYIKKWSSFDKITATEQTPFSFPPTKFGERDYGVNSSNAKNVNRASFARHLPSVNITNDEMNRNHLAMSHNVGSEALFSWNPVLSYVMGSVSNHITTPQGFRNQLRPCTSFEENDPETNNCTKISDYVKPVQITNNFKLRENDYLAFSCSSSEPGCISYCHYQGKVYEGGDTYYYSTFDALLKRRWIYELSAEYASYDDMVAIPYEDITNDNYWVGYYGRNAQFDPFITTVPADAQSLDDTQWPYFQYSETGKKISVMGLVLACRKEASIYKYYKNKQTTHTRDWPQQNADFTVDRRPGHANPISVSGGTDRPDLLNWSSDNTASTSYWKKSIEINANNELGAALGTIGLNKFFVDHITWNYNRGIRRFMIWVPCGTMHYIMPNNELNAAYTSAVSSSMKKRVYDKIKVNLDGTYDVVEKFVNPAEVCWYDWALSRTMSGGGTLIIPNVAQAESLPSCDDTNYVAGPCFNPEARLTEYLTWLQDFINNKNSSSNLDDHVDVGLYIGYTIPTVNGEPAHGEHVIVGDAGVGNWLQNTTGPTAEGKSVKGWQIPDPLNNIKHADFLREELQPWFDAGINFLGFDVSVGMFNYQNGGTLTYGSNAASRDPVGDYKAWLMNEWPQLKTVICEAIPVDFTAPILNEFNEIQSTTFPRKTMYDIDPQIEVCKGQLVTEVSASENTFNRVYTDSCWINKGRERFRKLDPDGKTETNTTLLSYSPKAYQYSPYIATVSGYLNSAEWNINLETNNDDSGNWTTWGGIDPNKMLCWYRGNTEIGAFVENFYLLSPSLLKAYRTQNPTEKDPVTGWQTYQNIWQYAPAWDDAGAPNPSPKPSGLQPWDGRNTRRDEDYYNKVRNEMFLSVKNYIDRGYVFWSSTSKNDPLVIKDAHADTLTYVKFKEQDTSVYAEDTTQIPSELNINNLLLEQPQSPLIEELNSLLGSEVLGTEGLI